MFHFFLFSLHCLSYYLSSTGKYYVVCRYLSQRLSSHAIKEITHSYSLSPLFLSPLFLPSLIPHRYITMHVLFSLATYFDVSLSASPPSHHTADILDEYILRRTSFLLTADAVKGTKANQPFSLSLSLQYKFLV